MKFLELSITDQIEKEMSSSIENDTLTVCKENHYDFRQFVNVLSETIGTRTTTTQSSQSGKLPVIYFVTPTYPS